MPYMIKVYGYLILVNTIDYTMYVKGLIWQV